MAVTCALQALSLLAEKGENGEKTTYDLVLADVHMPVMDGFELVGHIQRDYNIPVVCKFLYIHNFTLKLIMNIIMLKLSYKQQT